MEKTKKYLGVAEEGEEKEAEKEDGGGGKEYELSFMPFLLSVK